MPSNYDKHNFDLGIAKDEREPNYVQNYGGEKFVHTQNGRIGFFLASRSKSYVHHLQWTPEIPPTARDRNAEALRPTSTSQ